MDAPLQGRLLPGEKILWEGRPKAGLMLTGADLLLVPFSLVWCGFAVFWTVTAATATWSSRAAPPVTPIAVFPLFGLLFVAVGLYFVVGRFIADAWLRERTRYALTDSRALIVRAPPFGKVTTIALDRLAEVSLQRSSDGSGTIRLGPRAPLMGRNGFAAWSPALDATPQFIGISDSQRIFELLQRQMARPDRAAGLLTGRGAPAP
jgi:hypothetical protein